MSIKTPYFRIGGILSVFCGDLRQGSVNNRMYKQGKKAPFGAAVMAQNMQRLFFWHSQIVFFLLGVLRMSLTPVTGVKLLFFGEIQSNVHFLKLQLLST